MLKDGSVAETPGTHEQLINTGGVYSSLWAGEFESPPPFLGEHRLILGGCSARDDAGGDGEGSGWRNDAALT